MNFSLPSEIIIQGLRFPTISIFIIIGVISWFFSMWYEGRRDGFDEEKLLDIAFAISTVSVGGGYALYRYLNWLSIYDPYNILLKLDKNSFVVFTGFFLGCVVLVYLCKFWSWSKYRLLDIYVSSLSQLGFFLAFGGYLIYKSLYLVPLLILLPLIYTLILRLRGFQFISGATFSIFVMLSIPYIVLFYRSKGYLFFCFMLATISIINFYLRWRKNYAGTTSFGRVYKTVKRKATKKAARPTKRTGTTKK